MFRFLWKFISLITKYVLLAVMRHFRKMRAGFPSILSNLKIIKTFTCGSWDLAISGPFSGPCEPHFDLYFCTLNHI